MVFIGILIALLMIGLAILSRSITTLIHELGHAIPSLLFTRNKVCIYVGSYGDVSKSIHLRLGRLEAFLRINVFDWNIGLCQHEAARGFWANLLIILFGPLASLCLAGGLTYLIAYGGYSDDWRSLMAIFALSAVWDFFVNILPESRPMELHDGSVVYNDGTQLMRLIDRQKFPEAYYKAMEYQQEGKYDRAIEELGKTIEAGHKKKEIFQRLIHIQILNKDNYEALATFEAYRAVGDLNAFDYNLLGKVYMGISKYASAIKSFNQAIFLDYRNPEYRSRRGQAYLKMGDFDEAISDFDAAINFGSRAAITYASRGLALLRKEEPSAALNDLQAALQIDPHHPQTHLYLGLYHYKRLAYPRALKHFEEAERLGVNDHSLAHYLAELRTQVN
ncbi:MAG: tetratricopeptide repeat protein [Bacteroidota bacterium]